MPRRPSPNPDDVVKASGLGVAIRAARKAQGFTLKKVASETGLTHAFLSMVERGLAKPSVVSLLLISKALGASVSELLSEDVQAPSVEVGRGIVDSDDPYDHLRSRTLLALPGRVRVIETWTDYPERLAVPPEVSVPHRHDFDELMYVVRGEVELVPGVAESVLVAGQSVYLPAGTEHRWAQRVGVDTLLILILVDPAP